MPIKNIRAFENNYIPNLNLDTVLPALNRSQDKHDSSIAIYNQNLQNDLSQGYLDPQARDKYIQEQEEAFNQVLQNNRGNLAAGYQDVVSTITSSKANPWHQLNKRQMEQAQIEQELVTQYGPNALQFSNVSGESLLDSEGNYRRDINNITANVLQADDYGNNLERQLAEMSAVVRGGQTGLVNSKTLGILQSVAWDTSKLTEEDLMEVLSDPRVYNAFLSSNPTAQLDYRENVGGTGDPGQLGTGNVFSTPETFAQWGIGHIIDKKVDEERDRFTFMNDPKPDGGRGGGYDFSDLSASEATFTPQVTVQEKISEIADKMSPTYRTSSQFTSGPAVVPGQPTASIDTSTSIPDIWNRGLKPEEKEPIINTARSMGIAEDQITNPDNWYNIQAAMRNVDDLIINTPIYAGTHNILGQVIGLPDVKYFGSTHTGERGFAEWVFGNDSKIEFNDDNELVIEDGDILTRRFYSPDGEIMSGEQFKNYIEDNKDEYEGQGFNIKTIDPENPYSFMTGDDVDFVLPYGITIGNEFWVMSNPNGIKLTDAVGNVGFVANNPNTETIQNINQIYRLKLDPIEFSQPVGGTGLHISYVSPDRAGAGITPGYYIGTESNKFAEPVNSESAKDAYLMLHTLLKEQ